MHLEDLNANAVKRNQFVSTDEGFALSRFMLLVGHNSYFRRIGRYSWNRKNKVNSFHKS
jgi:hypothetical protein